MSGETLALPAPAHAHAHQPYSDILNLIGGEAKLTFLPAAKPRRKMDHKFRSEVWRRRRRRRRRGGEIMFLG